MINSLEDEDEEEDRLNEDDDEEELKRDEEEHEDIYSDDMSLLQPVNSRHQHIEYLPFET